MDSDTVITTSQTKMSGAYGHGASAIPWAQIFAMVMSLLSGCITPPTTAAEVRAAAKRPLTKIQFMRRLHAQGIFGQAAERIYTAFVTSIDAATDAEILDGLAVASETA